MRRAEDEGWGLREGAQFEGLRQWLNGREGSLGSRQRRIVNVVAYQDDLLVSVMGKEAANRTKRRPRSIIQEEIGIKINTKKDARKPFGSSFGVIGAGYRVADSLYPSSDPTETIKIKVRGAADNLSKWKGRAVPKVWCRIV